MCIKLMKVRVLPSMKSETSEKSAEYNVMSIPTSQGICFFWNMIYANWSGQGRRQPLATD